MISEQMINDVAIIGASGFIGQRLQSLLRDQGCCVLTPTREELNVVNKDDWKHFFATTSVRWLFYLAGATPVQVAAAPDQAYEVNVSSIHHLLKYVPTSCRVIYTSSVHVYGPPAYLPLDEEHPIRPNTDYGRHKQMAELALLQSRHDCVIARLFHCIDLTDPPRGSFLHDWIQQKPPVCVGNIQVERDFIHVIDACRALVKVAQKGCPSDIYNICSGKSTALVQIIEHLGFAYKVEKSLLREGDHKRLIGSNQKLVDLGWFQELSPFFTP